MKTRQECVDQVYDWFIIKGNPLAKDEDNGGCRYRTPEGHRCAIGCLIPDDKYDPKIDDAGYGWIGGFSEETIISIGLNPEEKSFYENLQQCHDLANNKTDMFNRVQKLCHRYNLHYPSEK